jgi:predicted ATPase/DNA-binding winged helix-turn-helix (wHTH) protein
MHVEFDGYAFDSRTRELTDPTGATVALEPQAFDVLELLISNRDRVVPRAEIIDSVWGSQFVSDSALATRIKEIRRAVGDDGKAQRVIKTVHGRGVRFVASASEGGGKPAPPPDPGVPAVPGAAYSIDPELLVGPIVGRIDDLDLLTEKSGQHRVVTLVGPGGVGKTHLLHHLGARLDSTLTHGAVIIELAPLRRGDEIAAAALAALGVSDEANADPMVTVAAHLRDKELFVLLDNAEHLLDDVADFCRAVLTESKGTRLLVSSRRPLGILGEAVHHVAPLSTDESAELFVRQARLAGVDMSTTDDAVRTLCDRVDGVPLAVRVLAGRAGVFSISDLSVDVLGHLRRGDEDIEHGRHESVESALAWSIDQLDDIDRRALEDLATMAGWFDLEAATAVTDASDLASTILRLQRHSLVSASPDRSVSRFRLLEPIRLFALESRGERLETDERHARYFLSLAQIAARAIDTPDIDRGFQIIDDEWSNISVAFEHFRRSNNVDSMTAMVSALDNYAEAKLSGPIHRMTASAFQSCIENDLDVPLELRANHARFSSHQGDLDRIGVLLEGIDDDQGDNRMAVALLGRDFYGGDVAATQRILQAALERVQGTGGFSEIAFSSLTILSMMFGPERSVELACRLEAIGRTGGEVAQIIGRFGAGARHVMTGEMDRGLRLLTEAEEALMERRLSGLARMATSMRSIAVATIDDVDLKRTLVARSLERGIAIGAGSMMAGDMARAAMVLAEMGSKEDALTLAAAVDASGFSAGAQALSALRARLGESPDRAAGTASMIGAHMSLQEAAQFAVEALGTP